MKFCRVLISHAVIVAAVIFHPGISLATEAKPFPQEREARPLRVAVLDFGETETGARAAEALRRAFAVDPNLKIMDGTLVRDAARGAAYAGSLNMTLQEARDLSAAIGCDFFITGDAQTLRRSPSMGAAYFEAYASVFIVSAARGKLLRWTRTHFEAATPADAEKQLLKELNHTAANYLRALGTAFDEENNRRTQTVTQARQAVVYEDVPADNSPAAKNFRAPQPYQRLRPPYPETAAQAEAEATVDASVEVDTNGEVANVEIVRWAGFGLDDAAASAIRQLHFRPAMRDKVPVPVRVLLRYNFRRPPKSK